MTVAHATAAPPLSVAQEALWYQAQLAPRRLTYNETVSLRRDGPVDAGVLRRVLDELVERHAAWRTTFDLVDGEPVQVVHPARATALPVIDLRGIPEAVAEERAVALVAEAARVPYDLRRGPLLRARLVRFPGDHHRLYLAMHHVIFDGVSLRRVVLPELAARYEALLHGAGEPPPEPAASYADYARWEQQWMQGRRAARRLAFWREHLSGLRDTELPVDRPRRSERRFRGGVLAVSMPPATAEGLAVLARAAGATRFQALAAIWAATLGQLSGAQDVAFGTVADLRQRPEFEAVVGYAVTPAVVRVDLGGAPSWSELVTRARNELLDVLDHLVPFERVVRELAATAPANANPLYRTMLVLEPAAASADGAWRLAMLETEVGDAVGAARLDLELQLDERPDGGLDGRLLFDRDLFDRATAAAIVAHWGRLAEAAVADLEASAAQAPPLSAAQRDRLAAWNAGVRSDPPGATIPALVRAQADRDPAAPAVTSAGEQVSRGELQERAAATAGRLAAAGVGPGWLVAVGTVPSADLLAAALAALELGAAYVIADPAAAPAGSDRDLDPAVCCVQASGKDGVVAHRRDAAVRVVAGVGADVGLGAADTALVLPSTVAHAPALEPWLALCAGARVVMASGEQEGSGAALGRLMTAEGVTFLHATASTWARLVATGFKPGRALCGLSGGQLAPELSARLLRRCRVLWQAWGSPEAGTYATLGRADPATAPNVGRPLAGATVAVVDDRGEPVPPGMVGRIEVANPPGAGPAAVTGERGRWLLDGRLQLHEHH